MPNFKFKEFNEKQINSEEGQRGFVLNVSNWLFCVDSINHAVSKTKTLPQRSTMTVEIRSFLFLNRTS